MRRQKGSASTVIAIVVAIMALVFLGLGLAIFQLFNLATIVKPGGTGPGSGGPYLSDGTRAGPGVACILADEYFRDTSISDEPDALVKLQGLIGRRRFNAVYPNIRDVLTTAKNKKINAVVPLGIWNGETSYNARWLYKAFGAGFKDSGVTPGSPGWDNQLNSPKSGVLSRIELAINGTSPYSPIPTNLGPDLVFTRLFYHYTTAMKELYEANNNRWVVNAQWLGTGINAGQSGYPAKDRITIMQALKPGQIKCDNGGVSASGVPKT
jgi:hypothetical protein